MDSVKLMVLLSKVAVVLATIIHTFNGPVIPFNCQPWCNINHDMNKIVIEHTAISALDHFFQAC